MKKKLLAMALALGMCFTPAFASAESTPSVDEIEAKNKEFSDSITSESIDMGINVDLMISVSGSVETADSDGNPVSQDMNFDIPVVLTGNYLVNAIEDPVQCSMTGDFKINSISLYGTDLLPEQVIKMEIYMAQAEDSNLIDSYITIDDGTGAEPQWLHQQMDMTQMLGSMGAESLKDLENKQINEMFPDLDLDWQVTDGGETYDVSGKLNFSDLMPLMEQSMQASGQAADEDVMEITATIIGALVANISSSYDKESGAAVSMHMDMNDSDINSILQPILEQTLSDSGMNINIQVNDFSIDATMTYDDVSEIAIPEEALSAEIVDTADMENALMDAVEAAE